MDSRWEDAEELLVEDAQRALCEHGQVEPALVAFAGANLRFVVWLRPFEGGAYHKPMIELLALASTLDCDRLMVSFAGRVWSPEAPPPHESRGDPRQRAVVIHAVDGAAGAPRPGSALHPITVDAAGEVQLGPRWDPGPPTGWVSQALVAAVRGRARMRTSWTEIAIQAARVDRLGHCLYVAPDLMTLLTEGLASGRR